MAVSEQHRKLFEIFKEAIDDERRSQDLYAQAQALCADDPVMSTLFKELQEEEAIHEQRLMDRYRQIRPLVTAE